VAGLNDLKIGMVLFPKNVSGESNSVDKTGEEYENRQSSLPSILKNYRSDGEFNADETAIFIMIRRSSLRQKLAKVEK
jgi:hypothetical protein